MATKKKIIDSLLRQNKKIIHASSVLSSELQKISDTASKATGIQFQADICGGDEIEFRPIATDGVAIQEPIATRLEDVIECVKTGDKRWIEPQGVEYLTYNNNVMLNQ